MKIKFVPSRSGKKVQYYNYRFGVVKKSARSNVQLLGSLMGVTFVLGGIGFGGLKVVDFVQARNQNASTSYQRESETNVDTTKKQVESEDKLKKVSLKAREDEALAKQIKNKLKNVPGGQKWSVYVRDLNSDSMASINADTQMEAGALGNLFLMPPLETKLASSSWGYKMGGRTLEQCVVEMIKTNDESCRQSVSRYVDMKNANSVNESHGFKKTQVDNKRTETTAREIGDLLFRLQNSQVISDKARRAVFDGLYAQKQREGLPAGCDVSCLVANVAAEGKTFRHDAAIVTSGKTKYVVVVMSSNASWSQIKDVSSEIRLLMQP